jgi:hypothetical protein
VAYGGEPAADVLAARESLIEPLAAGIAEAADQEADPERKRRLAVVARELGGMAKAIAVNVASQML